MLSLELTFEMREVRHKLHTLYRNHVIVLSDFERLMATWNEESFDFQKMLTAVDFAALKHRGQVRNHADWVPYLIHPLRVALLLHEEAAVVEEDLLVASLLHDTLEDTETSSAEIAELFGEKVRSLVEELTELPGQSLDEAMGKMSHEAKVIKLADRTHNLRDLIDHPPRVWHSDKVTHFIQRSLQLLQKLQGTHSVLEKKCLEALKALHRINQF